MRKHIFFFSILTLAGCGQQTKQTSDTTALVTQQQASAAFDVVKGIDYLPFTYIVDGCYARSLYMSMELAAHGIPSSAHYVYGVLRPTTTVAWGYHVAPLLQLKDSTQEPWILDPAFEKEPLTRKQWVAKNFAQSSDGVEALAARTESEVRAGSAYFTRSDEYRQFDIPRAKLFTLGTNANGSRLIWSDVNPQKLIPDFATMPAFMKSDIQHACSVMHDYIAREAGLTSTEKTAKRNRLLASTQRLASDMVRVGKLHDDGFYQPESLSMQSCTDAIDLGTTAAGH